ncbi:hypothetical protein [Hymenobacter sp. 102]|uniref:hypothetical protein n=1 Tax=Hymenobacter sp. 102 TaxID=3403152 RepID=UPI003CE74CE0
MRAGGYILFSLGLGACNSASVPRVNPAPVQVVGAEFGNVSLPVPDSGSTAALRRFLARHPLTEYVEYLDAPNFPNMAMQGFSGPENRRIEVLFEDLQPVAGSLNVWTLKGKTRYRENIQPITGQIVLNRMRRLAPRRPTEPNLETYQVSESDGEGLLGAFPPPPGFETVASYTIRGAFCWAQPRQPGNGYLYGLVDIDLAQCRNGRYMPQSVRFTEGAKGGNAKFEGVWTSYATGHTRRVVFVQDVLLYGTRVFQRFTLGQRMPEFNPQYARLGWSGYWSGEEWWANPVAASETKL